MVLDALIEALRPFRDLVLPGVFGAFLVGTVLTLVLADGRVGRRLGVADRRLIGRLVGPDGDVVRRLWLSAFLSGILFTSLVGVPILPFVDMNKFSDRTEPEFTYQEIRVVDEEGAEIRYDMRAVPPVAGGSRHSRLAGMMVHDFTEAERLEMGTFLFERAVAYRTEVEADETSVVERLEAPYYSQEPPWQPADLEAMAAFDSLVIYERTIVYGDDDTEIVDRRERELLAIDPATERVEERGEI